MQGQRQVLALLGCVCTISSTFGQRLGAAGASFDAEALKAIADALPRIVEKQGANATEILSTVKAAVEKATKNDETHATQIQELKDLIDRLAGAETAANDHTPAGTN